MITHDLLFELVEIESDLLTARTELIDLEYERDKLLPINEKFTKFVKKHTLDICAGAIGITGGIGLGVFINKKHKVGNKRKVYLDDGTLIGYF